nr:MAG TPA: hypothetical protein [Caudoviricetes sp.]
MKCPYRQIAQRSSSEGQVIGTVVDEGVSLRGADGGTCGSYCLRGSGRVVSQFLAGVYLPAGKAGLLGHRLRLIKGRWLVGEHRFGRCRRFGAEVNEILHPPEEHQSAGLDVVGIHTVIGLAVVFPGLEFPGKNRDGIAFQQHPVPLVQPVPDIDLHKQALPAAGIGLDAVGLHVELEHLLLAHILEHRIFGKGPVEQHAGLVRQDHDLSPPAKGSSTESSASSTVRASACSAASLMRVQRGAGACPASSSSTAVDSASTWTSLSSQREPKVEGKASRSAWTRATLRIMVAFLPFHRDFPVSYSVNFTSS